MLGIHTSEGTAEGWFGKGILSATVSILIIAILVLGIGFGIYAAVNAREETSVNQPIAPVVPVAPTTVTPPTATNSPAPAGVIKITAEELVKQLLDNPDKYKKGTVFQVSGVFIWEMKRGLWPHQPIRFFLSSNVYANDQLLGVTITVREKEKEAFTTFNSLGEEDGEVIVQGTAYFFDKGGVALENCSLVSATPAK